MSALLPCPHHLVADGDRLLAALGTEDESVYHAQRATHLGSHALGDFRRCPLAFRRKELGLIADGDRPAYRFGRGAHCRILEGAEIFAQRYAIGGPINPKTNRTYGEDTKAFAEWAAAQGRPVLSDDQAATIEQMAGAVTGHAEAMDLLHLGRAEGVVRCAYAGTPCQIRIDWLNPERGLIDLKTVDDMTWFESQIRSFGYAHQVAFYRGVLAAATGATVPSWLIAVEKAEPFRVGVWRIADAVLDAAARDNVAAIGRLQQCRTTDVWPTGYEVIRSYDYLA